MDIVNHTNNIAYMRIVLDALETKDSIQEIHLNYLN